MQIWDTAGGTATLDRLGPGFWRKAAAFLYILSVSDVSSFAALTALHSMLQDQVPCTLALLCIDTCALWLDGVIQVCFWGKEVAGFASKGSSQCC